MATSSSTRRRHGMYLPMVAWLIAIPSLSSSPWIRGAPQSVLAMLIWRIRSRVANTPHGDRGILFFMVFPHYKVRRSILRHARRFWEIPPSGIAHAIPEFI